MNWHDLLHYLKSRLEHWGMTWLNYIIDTSQNKHRGTIHEICKWIHPEVTYTSTLPINREGIILTQFFITSLLLWIISSSASSSHIHIQVIFIFRLASSSSHLHFQVIFIFKSSSYLDPDHRLIWIVITGSGSSLDLDHHHWIWIITRSGSSPLDLDHHSIWIIITGSRSSLNLDHHC